MRDFDGKVIWDLLHKHFNAHKEYSTFFDHVRVLKDTNGKVVIISEPYSKAIEGKDLTVLNRLGYDFVQADFGVGIHNPPHCPLLLMTRNKNPADLASLLLVVNKLKHNKEFIKAHNNHE
jgi:hypothetical protein